MKRRLFLRLGLLAIVGFAVAYLYAWCTSPSRRINRETFDRIQVGMTEQEVMAIVGLPTGVYSHSWAKFEGHRVNSIAHALESEARVSKRKCERVWASDQGILMVMIGRDGRVFDADFLDATVSFVDFVQGLLPSRNDLVNPMNE